MRNIFLITLCVTFSFSGFAQENPTINYLALLKRAAKYTTSPVALLEFTYQSSNDGPLIALRKNFDLDHVAGFGNETSRLLNILHWVHNLVPHNGQVESGIKVLNADEIITTVKTKKIGVSCGELATVLNDCYLAMGWRCRKVYCFPKDSLHNDPDSHVINIVYLSSKKKWIWVDPTNDAYVMDERGELLSIEEVRQRLINNQPLILTPEANWNHRTSVTKDFYLLSYMAKNLYRFYCPLNSEYDYETRGIEKKISYVNLLPLDYKMPMDAKTNAESISKTGIIKYYTTNSKWFWKLPGDE